MYAYTMIEHEFEVMNEVIENEMRKVREEALRKLSPIFAHQNNLKMDFALILAYSWGESQTSAQKIADELDFCKLDLLAITEDFDGFKEEYLKHYEEAQNF